MRRILISCIAGLAMLLCSCTKEQVASVIDAPGITSTGMSVITAPLECYYSPNSLSYGDPMIDLYFVATTDSLVIYDIYVEPESVGVSFDSKNYDDYDYCPDIDFYYYVPKNQNNNDFCYIMGTTSGHVNGTARLDYVKAPFHFNDEGEVLWDGKYSDDLVMCLDILLSTDEMKIKFQQEYTFKSLDDLGELPIISNNEVLAAIKEFKAKRDAFNNR